MTPHDIHYGLAAAKWQQRAEVLRAAYGAYSERFPRGVPGPPPLPTAAWINKPLLAPALACHRQPAHDGNSQISDVDCLIRLDIFRRATSGRYGRGRQGSKPARNAGNELPYWKRQGPVGGWARIYSSAA
jgi:hypothetical protein